MGKKSAVSRRNFIQRGVAAASAPAVLGLAGSLFAGSGPEVITCGVIGTGGRGRYLMENAINAPGVKVAALCDIDQKALETALAAAGEHKPKTYTYYKRLLEHPGLDAVFVATPPYLHKPMIIDVLDAGKHCYAEKPMCITVHDLDAVLERSRTAAGILQVGQQLRFLPQYHKLMSRLHGGEFGRIGFIRCQRYADWEGPGSRGEMKWLWSIEESGDQILEQSVHELDVINWLMNDHPVRIAGLGGQNLIFEPEGCNVSDHYGLTLEYPGGRHAVFSMTKYAPYEIGGRIINAYAEKASVDAPLSGPSRIFWRGESTRPPEEITAEEVNTTYEAVKGFFQSIRQRTQPVVDAETGRTAALTAMLGRKAIYERRVATWDELLTEGAPVRPVRD
ncbi:MAG: Gfo/Idh/MocA family oxidoreductase [Candidatus Glassbacteria bacterium]|nr:Gfo/Idh/MocA family oxidoreductase [Candidatus Glassbacteria bacterium]